MLAKISKAAQERLRKYHNDYQRKYYEANREEILARNRKSQAKSKGKPGRKPGRPKGKTGRKPGRKPAAKSNLSAKERLRIYRAKYYKANREKILASNRKSQAKSKGKPGRKPGRPKGKTGRKPGRKPAAKSNLSAKERLRIYRAKYYKQNKKKILAQNRKYQAKLKTGKKPKGKPGRPKGKPGRKPGRPKGKPGRKPQIKTKENTWEIQGTY